MADEQSLDDILQLVRQAAETAGTVVVEAILTAEKEEGALVTALGPDDFLKLVGHCSPKVVYLHTETFDAEEAVINELDPNDDDDGELANDRQVKSLVKTWKAKDGALSMVLASFVADSVLHVLLEMPPWLDDFEEAVEGMVDQKEQGRLAREEHGTKEIQRMVTTNAKTLAKHPMFNASRPSREKRIYLAKELFPETSEVFILQIVDEAINMDWLNSGRVS